MLKKNRNAPVRLIHCVRIQLAFAEQIRLVLADIFRIELIGWTLEVTCQVRDRGHIRTYSTLRVITTLEFLEHYFSNMGHRDLLVTQHYPNFHNRPSNAHAKRLPLGFVQVSLGPSMCGLPV
jgi:hypothetical protein